MVAVSLCILFRCSPSKCNEEAPDWRLPRLQYQTTPLIPLSSSSSHPHRPPGLKKVVVGRPKTCPQPQQSLSLLHSCLRPYSDDYDSYSRPPARPQPYSENHLASWSTLSWAVEQSTIPVRINGTCLRKN